MDDPDQAYCDGEVEMNSEIYLKNKNNSEFDLYEDAHIKLSNLTIPLEGLQLFCSAFSEWRTRAIGKFVELKDIETFFNISLMNDGEREMEVLLRTSDEKITSTTHPLFEFCYNSWTTTNFANSFVIDQSCAKIFTDNLKAVIEE
jgi:hypothetical protein